VRDGTYFTHLLVSKAVVKKRSILYWWRTVSAAEGLTTYRQQQRVSHWVTACPSVLLSVAMSVRSSRSVVWRCMSLRLVQLMWVQKLCWLIPLPDYRNLTPPRYFIIKSRHAANHSHR